MTLLEMMLDDADRDCVVNSGVLAQSPALDFHQATNYKFIYETGVITKFMPSYPQAIEFAKDLSEMSGCEVTILLADRLC